MRAPRTARLRAALLASTALIAGASLGLGASAVHAQNATWLTNPGTADFDTAGNWTPISVPTGTAFFGASSQTSLAFSAASTSIGGFTFNAGASNYNFVLGNILTFTGAGILVNGGSVAFTNEGTLNFNNSSTAGSAIFTNNGGILNFNNNSTAGSATITNNFGLDFYNSCTAGNATITNNLILNFFDSSTAGNATITITDNNITSQLEFFNSSTAGNANITNNNNTTFYDSSTAGNATITNNGFLSFVTSSTAGNATITNNNGGFLGFSNSSTAGNATITTNSGGETYFLNTASGGTARFILNGTGLLDISLLTNGGTTAGSIEGSGNVFLGANNLAVGDNDLPTTFSGVISDCGAGGNTCFNPGSTGGSLTKTGTGTLILTNTETYTGPTNVNAGVLEVNGSIATSSLTTVNNGGTLTGVGVVGATLVNSGGVFAPGGIALPGTSMTVAGNLAFQSGAIYLVSLNPTATTMTNVTGTASLAGTVEAFFTPGTYVVPKSYEILQSSGLGGTQFSSVIASPPNFRANLSYTAADVFLNLTAILGLGGNLTVNQNNVATALNNFFNTGGTLPPNFATVFGLTGPALANALNQIDGEASVDAEATAFKSMDQFLALMLDPFVDGRTGSPGGGALGFAPDQPASFPPDVALAYDSVLKAPPKPAGFDQRWTAWGAAYGGTSNTNGDPAVIGSTNFSAQTYGFAAGMDRHISPDLVAGFALAGGGTHWDLAQAMGGGRSDAFQVGAYATKYFGPAYVAADIAFANHWMTTSRTAFAGDQLTANFNAQSYGGRIEAGYRYALPATWSVTPYGALQVQNFHTPQYSETDLTGGGFGLTYNAMSAYDTRGELGARFDEPTTLNGMPLTLRARLAWAHDWVNGPALQAVFETLPGANFIVNGAAVAKNSALTTAGAELHLTQAWSLLAKFDGEFAKGSQTYAGTGTLRYAW